MLTMSVYISSKTPLTSIMECSHCWPLERGSVVFVAEQPSSEQVKFFMHKTAELNISLPPSQTPSPIPHQHRTVLIIEDGGVCLFIYVCVCLYMCVFV